MKRTPWMLLVALTGMALASCGVTTASTNSTQVFSTPLAATYSWFRSIDLKEPKSVIAHAAPSARYMMDWNDGDTSLWPSFSRIACKVAKEATNTTALLCTFKENAPPGNNPDTFWSVSLKRSVSGKWLITNYGQG
jgi:hypothetical protein